MDIILQLQVTKLIRSYGEVALGIWNTDSKGSNSSFVGTDRILSFIDESNRAE